jgi:RNA polymerase sigma-70 factor (ECF subfamily)
VTDADVVRSFQAGERAAFATLFDRHAPAVAAAARARGARADAIADVVQETFERALRRAGDLRDPGRFRAWVLAIARNVAVDQARRRVATVTLDDEGVHPAAAERGPCESAEVRELAGLVDGCLAGLSRRDATALTMITHLGFGPTDVAAALGTSETAAKVLLHRARRRLRDAVVGELLARDPSAGCATFATLAADADPDAAAGAAARHARTCPTCTDAARRHLGLPPGGGTNA